MTGHAIRQYNQSIIISMRVFEALKFKNLGLACRVQTKYISQLTVDTLQEMREAMSREL